MEIDIEVDVEHTEYSSETLLGEVYSPSLVPIANPVIDTVQYVNSVPVATTGV